MAQIHPPAVKVRMPEIKIPEIKIPEIKVPQVNVPPLDMSPVAIALREQNSVLHEIVNRQNEVIRVLEQLAAKEPPAPREPKRASSYDVTFKKSDGQTTGMRVVPKR